MSTRQACQRKTVRDDPLFMEMLYSLDTAQLGAGYTAAIDELVAYVDNLIHSRLPPDPPPSNK